MLEEICANCKFCRYYKMLEGYACRVDLIKGLRGMTAALIQVKCCDDYVERKYWGKII